MCLRSCISTDLDDVCQALLGSAVHGDVAPREKKKEVISGNGLRVYGNIDAADLSAARWIKGTSDM